MDAVINIRGLHTRLGRQWIHQDLSLQAHPGEVLGIAGGSGSGKTCLLRVMIGLMPFQQGQVQVLGEPLSRQPSSAFRRRMAQRWAVLFQHGALFSTFNVFDNIAFPLRELTTLDKGSIHERVMLRLQWVGLSAADAYKRPSQLSGGMVKRVALARALASDAELLFLDEPTAGLDPISAANFDALIRDLQQRLKLTVVMVTHDLDTLHGLCDRIALLAERQVVALGTPAQILANPHPAAQAFFRGERGLRMLQTGALDGKS